MEHRPLSFLEISGEALRHNITEIKRLVGDSQQVIAVVKANAYGHGFAPVVSAVENEVEGFQVDDLEELRAVRALTAKRILVLGYVQESDLAEAISLGGELAIYDWERLELLRSLPPCRVHLKIDALLGRQGVLPSEVAEFITAIRSMPSIELAGIYSHFSNLEDTTSLEHGLAQIRTFEAALSSVDIGDAQTHLSSTAGILLFEGSESSRHLVRLGIGMYGLAPSETLVAEKEIFLKPALRWISHIAQFKLLPAGHPVGYGLTYTTEREMLIGIVPQGYSDGLDRKNSNNGFVLVHGVRCPIIGRVAMNMIAVDLSSATEAKPGDEVVLIGTQGDAVVTADEIAAATDTINYEVVARLNPLLPRFLV